MLTTTGESGEYGSKDYFIVVREMCLLFPKRLTVHRIVSPEISTLGTI